MKLGALILSLVFLFVLVKQPGRLLNRKSGIKSVHVLLFLFLSVAFVFNNLWEAANDVFKFKDYKASPLVAFLAITISSIHEEIFYRGAVQTYINDRKGKGKYFISRGNLV